MMLAPHSQALASEGMCAGKPVEISFLHDGTVLWAGEVVDDDALKQRFAAAAALRPTRYARLVANKQSNYDVVARVLAIAQKAGFGCFGFVGIETPN